MENIIRKVKIYNSNQCTTLFSTFYLLEMWPSEKKKQKKGKKTIVREREGPMLLLWFEFAFVEDNFTDNTNALFLLLLLF